MTVSNGVLMAAVLLGTVAGSTAVAHHSFAMYDNTRSITVKGTVTKWQWANPHAYLEIETPGAGGKPARYVFEGTSVNLMQRQGWRSNMIKLGDTVTAVASPAKSGEPSGLLLEVTFANGETKSMSIPDGYTFKRTSEAK